MGVRFRSAVEALVLMAGLQVACNGAISETDPLSPSGSQNAGGAGSPTPPPNGGGPNAGPQMPSDGPPKLEPVQPLCVSGQRSPWPSHVALLTNEQIWATLEDVVGMGRNDWRGEVMVGTRPLVFGFDNQSALSAVTSLPLSAWTSFVQENLATARTRVQVPCRSMDESCQRQVVEALGRRAFRRALTTQEIDELRRFFGPTVSANFDEALEGVLAGLLLSPNFLYRSQVAGANGQLDDAQLASWLSYTFRDAPPPRDLQPTQLRTPEGRKAVVTRWMESDPKFWGKLERFMGGYLGTSKIRSVNRDAQRYPGLTAPVREAMEQEIGRFGRWVFEKGTGRFAELFDTNKVFINRALADHYKVGWQGGDTYQLVDLTGTPAAEIRGGLLTTGAFTASHAHDTETAPVVRGVYVREHLLCHDLPEVPPTLDIMPPVANAKLTTRERFRQHSDSPACAGCHRAIDPIGFGFERYDADGTYRTMENGLPVDASGEVRGIETWSDDKVHPFNGPKALGKFLATSPVAQSCFARQIWRYYVAIAESKEDACDVAMFQEAFTKSGGDLKGLLLELAAHPLADRRRTP